MGWCLHPIWGVLKKKIFATRTYPPYLYLTPPTFQILEISLIVGQINFFLLLLGENPAKRENLQKIL